MKLNCAEGSIQHNNKGLSYLEQKSLTTTSAFSCSSNASSTIDCVSSSDSAERKSSSGTQTANDHSSKVPF